MQKLVTAILVGTLIQYFGRRYHRIIFAMYCFITTVPEHIVMQQYITNMEKKLFQKNT